MNNQKNLTKTHNCQLSIIHCQLILACHRFPARFYPGARLTAVGLSAKSFLFQQPKTNDVYDKQKRMPLLSLTRASRSKQRSAPTVSRNNVLHLIVNHLLASLHPAMSRGKIVNCQLSIVHYLCRFLEITNF